MSEKTTDSGDNPQIINNNNNIDETSKLAAHYLYNSLMDTANNAANIISNHNSSSSTMKLTNKPILEAYGTTLFIIFILHFVFYRQYKAKSKKRDVAVSLNVLVKCKRFHKAFIAIISHPPPPLTASDHLVIPPPPSLVSSTVSSSSSFVNNNINDNASSPSPQQSSGDSVNNNNNNNVNNDTSIIRFISILRRNPIVTFIHSLVRGPLAGLPLLTYICHILWQCRALEELYEFNYDEKNRELEKIWSNLLQSERTIHQYAYNHDSTNNIEKEEDTTTRSLPTYSYLRVLFTVSFTAFLLDIIIRSINLTFVQSVVQQSSSPSITIRQMHHRVLNDGICTFTSVAASVLIIFSNYFPNITITILPFLSSSSSLYKATDDPQLSFFICYFILFGLSFRVYNIFGMFYGLVSAYLWMFGVTSFLGTRYWGSFFIVVVALLCSLSVKAERSGSIGNSDSSNTKVLDFFPWIDYVSWDRDGVLLASDHNIPSRDNVTRGADNRRDRDDETREAEMVSLMENQSNNNRNVSDSDREDLQRSAARNNVSSGLLRRR